MGEIEDDQYLKAIDRIVDLERQIADQDKTIQSLLAEIDHLQAEVLELENRP